MQHEKVGEGLYNSNTGILKTAMLATFRIECYKELYDMEGFKACILGNMHAIASCRILESYVALQFIAISHRSNVSFQMCCYRQLWLKHHQHC